MVHQVLANPCKVHQRLDAKLVQLVLCADPRPVQYVGTAVRTPTDDNLLAGFDMHHRPVCLDQPHPRRPELPTHPLDNNLVDKSLGHDVDAAPRARLVGDKPRSGGAHTIVHAPGRVAAAVGVAAVGKQVVVQRQALVDERLEQQVRDGRQVVGLHVEQAVGAVLGLAGPEPVPAVEAFRLAHVGKHLVAAPALDVPVVKVLPRPADAERRVAPGAAAQELAARELDGAVVGPGVGLAGDVPVCFQVEELAGS